MIEIEQVTVRSGTFVLCDVSLQIPERAYGVLMGRTGSGKTTLLEAVCGLQPVHQGRIKLAGCEVTRTKPALRGVGYVPQDGALFTSQSVRQHLSFPLRIRRWPRDQQAARVAELARLLGLESLLDRVVHGLSGGEAQRVALGRALSFRPRILCLDEPLSALDDETRSEMRRVLRNIHESTDVTVLHVTHNSSDALHLADVLYLLREGRIVKGDPEHPSGRVPQPADAPTCS